MRMNDKDKSNDLIVFLFVSTVLIISGIVLYSIEECSTRCLRGV